MAAREFDVAAMLAGRPALLRDSCDRALAYLATVPDRPVAPGPGATAGLDAFDFVLPAAGLAAADVLARLDVAGSAGTVASNGPRYFGFVTGGALPIAQAAAWLGAAWDQNAALTVMSPVAARLGAAPGRSRDSPQGAMMTAPAANIREHRAVALGWALRTMTKSGMQARMN